LRTGGWWAQLGAERRADDDWSEAWAADGACRAKSAAERMFEGMGGAPGGGV